MKIHFTSYKAARELFLNDPNELIEITFKSVVYRKLVYNGETEYARQWYNAVSGRDSCTRYRTVEELLEALRLHTSKKKV